MNGDTIAWVLLERESADEPLPDNPGGARIPYGAIHPTREAAEAAAVEINARAGDVAREVVVTELIDRRS